MGNGQLTIDNCAPLETEGAQWTGTESNRRHKDFQSGRVKDNLICLSPQSRLTTITTQVLDGCQVFTLNAI